MTHAVDDGLAKAFPSASWLMLPAAAGEVLAVLTEALSPNWVVERETDYVGDVAIIALPADDIEQAPAFVLYEKDGQSRVAMIRRDEWEQDCGFTSFRQAMDAFVFQAKASTNDNTGAPEPRCVRVGRCQAELQIGG